MSKFKSRSVAGRVSRFGGDWRAAIAAGEDAQGRPCSNAIAGCHPAIQQHSMLRYVGERRVAQSAGSENCDTADWKSALRKDKIRYVNRKACEYLRNCDATFVPWMDRIGPIKHKARRLPPFHSLIRAIIHQQLSGTAAGTIQRRFQQLFQENELPSPEQVLATAPETLRSAGLSRAKLAYILDLAQKAIDGTVPSLEEIDRLSDDEIVARVTQIKGVGRWTAEMMLIFDLGRPDVLPVHDLSIRKGFAAVFRKRKLPKPEAIDKYGERWKPHRTTAAFYLWRASVLP